MVIQSDSSSGTAAVDLTQSHVAMSVTFSLSVSTSDPPTMGEWSSFFPIDHWL